MCSGAKYIEERCSYSENPSPTKELTFEGSHPFGAFNVIPSQRCIPESCPKKSKRVEMAVLGSRMGVPDGLLSTAYFVE